ncbi:hypothetical protein HpCOL199_10230 [Helicobacter pylori]
MGLFLISYFLHVRPQRQQQKKHNELIESLTKAAKIITKGRFTNADLNAEANIIRVKAQEATAV